MQPANYQAPDLAAAAQEATDDGELRRFLEAMRRWQSEEPAGQVEITPEAIRSTVDYVLSPHLDNVPDEELSATVFTLNEYLSALAETAEARLDIGRVVVAQSVTRARAVVDSVESASLRGARLAASTARDLILLLEQEGRRGDRAEMAS
ncbi:DUF6415 family natural product biosynthesis protein [Streptomyces bauhiniae]